MGEIRKIKENWYMAKWKEKTDKSKIQLILNVENDYVFLVSDWLTQREIEEIDLSDWNFKQWKDLEHKKKEVVSNA